MARKTLTDLYNEDGPLQAADTAADDLFLVRRLSATSPGLEDRVITREQLALALGAGGASSLPVADTTAVVKGGTDATKQLRFEVDGFTAGATRVLTPPNANATIAGLEVAQTFTAAQSIDVAGPTPATLLTLDTASTTSAWTALLVTNSGTDAIKAVVNADAVAKSAYLEFFNPVSGASVGLVGYDQSFEDFGLSGLAVVGRVNIAGSVAAQNRLFVGLVPAAGSTDHNAIAVTLSNAIAPTEFEANSVTLWAADFAAGDARLYMRTEGGVTTQVAGVSLAHTWSSLQTFSAGLNVAAGQLVQINADVTINRPAASSIRFSVGGSQGVNLGVPTTTPSQITSDQNNYAPAAGFLLRLSSDASRNVTGMAAGNAGDVKFVWNVGSNNIVFQHENASSTAANRFTTSTGADLTLAPGRCAFLMYDNSSSRWRVTLFA